MQSVKTVLLCLIDTFNRH